jgi:hypothetical protein
MEHLIQIVIKRLNEKGINIDLVPPLIRDVANVSISAGSDIKEMNRILGTLGWHEFDLDYHTFQLIEAVIERKFFANQIDVIEGIISKKCFIPQLFQHVAYSNAV